MRRRKAPCLRPLPSAFEPLVIRSLKQFALGQRRIEVHERHHLRLAGALVKMIAPEFRWMLEPRTAHHFGEGHHGLFMKLFHARRLVRHNKRPLAVRVLSGTYPCGTSDSGYTLQRT